MKRFTLHNPQDEIRQYQGRMTIIAVLIGLLLAALIARLVYLQIIQHPYYLTLSKQNLLSVSPIDPSRGLIYDRNKVLLADNIPVFSLEVVPDKVKNLKQAITDISQIIHLSDSDLQAFQKQLSQHRKFNSVPLKIKLSEEEMAVFALNQYRFPGFFIQVHRVRSYPFGALMEPVVGYVGRINAEEFSKVDVSNYSASNYMGKTGIEKYDETLLHGTVGIQQIETSAEGAIVRSTQNRPAIAGQNLYLTIDSRLQVALHQVMQNETGAIVAMDPRNGEILAFVSQPSFDPNQFVTGLSNKAYQALQQNPDRPLFNRILQGEFPPGSTMKPFYALGGLSNKVISDASSFFCPGFFKLPNSTHIYHDWNRAGHGNVDAEQAIIESCDVFFYHLAEKMGIDRMDNTLMQFGLGSPTGIDTYIERPGLVPSPAWKMHVHHQAWYPGDTVNMGIGQGYLLITPIQLATALMRLVNHGQSVQPHLLLKTESPTGSVSDNIPKKALSINNIPEGTWQLVLHAMREVVSNPHGTGYKAGHSAPYTFGGKSGTAQVFGLKGNQQDKAWLLPKKLRDHSWFMAFAPADHPTVVIVLLLEHGGEGRATYLAREILDSYFEIYPLQEEGEAGYE